MAFIRKMIIFGVIAAIGVFLLVGGIKDKVELSKPIKDISTISPDELYEGQFVEGNIYEMWNEFAYMEESSSKTSSKKVTAHYFNFPMPATLNSEQPQFLALRVSNSEDYATAQQMERETDSYYAYNIEPAEWTQIHIKGKVSKLKGELKQYQTEYIANSLNISEAEAEAYVCPYMVTSSYGDGTFGLILGIVFTVLGGGFLAFFIIRKVVAGR